MEYVCDLLWASVDACLLVYDHTSVGVGHVVYTSGKKFRSKQQGYHTRLFFILQPSTTIDNSRQKNPAAHDVKFGVGHVTEGIAFGQQG